MTYEIETSSRDISQLKTDDNVKCSIQSSGQDGQGAKVTLPQKLVSGQINKIHMTYEVQWVQSDIPWASRWDSYLKMSDVQIHWFSIVNSLVVVFFLAGILSMILLRSLRRDIAKYNREDEPVRVIQNQASLFKSL